MKGNEQMNANGNNNNNKKSSKKKKKNIFIKMAQYELFLTKAAYFSVANKFLSMVEI